MLNRIGGVELVEKLIAVRPTRSERVLTVKIDDFLKDYTVHDSSVSALDISGGILTAAIELAYLDDEGLVANLSFEELHDVVDTNLDKIRVFLQDGGDVGLLKFSSVANSGHFDSQFLFELTDYRNSARSYIELFLKSRNMTVCLNKQ